MKKSLQKAITDELPDANYPDFEPGDKIEVTTTKTIGGQERKRKFDGVCIARSGKGPDETFKIRKVSFGVGVERIYPIHSPAIDDIEILRKGKVRRAKLNYLEGRSAKESRIEEERVDLEEANRTTTQETSTTQANPDTDQPAETNEDVGAEEGQETETEVDDSE